MLARALEEDGFVLRTFHATKPPKVEYSLTAFGPGGRAAFDGAYLLYWARTVAG